MSKIARINANAKNSEAMRKLQKEYNRKKAPMKVAIEHIADMAIEIGLPYVKERLLPSGQL